MLPSQEQQNIQERLHELAHIIQGTSAFYGGLVSHDIMQMKSCMQ
jgi:hypothetical protein